jgi:hypothetical protein
MMLDRISSRLRRRAGGPARLATNWSSHSQIAKDGWLLVRVFYAVCLALHYGAWSRMSEAVKSLDAETAFWPIAWAAPFADETAAQVFTVFAFGVGFAGAEATHAPMSRGPVHPVSRLARQFMGRGQPRVARNGLDFSDVVLAANGRCAGPGC